MQRPGRFCLGKKADDGRIELVWPWRASGSTGARTATRSGVRTVSDYVYDYTDGYALLVVVALESEIELPTNDSVFRVNVGVEGQDPEALFEDLIIEAVTTAVAEFGAGGEPAGRVFVTDITVPDPSLR